MRLDQPTAEQGAGHQPGRLALGLGEPLAVPPQLAVLLGEQGEVDPVGDRLDVGLKEPVRTLPVAGVDQSQVAGNDR